MIQRQKPTKRNKRAKAIPGGGKGEKHARINVVKLGPGLVGNLSVLISTERSPEVREERAAEVAKERERTADPQQRTHQEETAKDESQGTQRGELSERIQRKPSCLHGSSSHCLLILILRHIFD